MSLIDSDNAVERGVISSNRGAAASFLLQNIVSLIIVEAADVQMIQFPSIP